MTIQSTATAFLAAFQYKHRTDGTPYLCLRDGSPEWMTDAIREAHGDMLPNDGIYARCEDAIRYIADGGTGDAAGEWADGDVSVYTAERAAWLAEAPITRMALCDEATDQYGAAESISDAIARGWFMESEQIYAALWNACEAATEDEAAPDMLAALQAMLAYYSGGRINNPAQRAAYRAVSLATGKPLPDWVPPHE